MRLFSILFLILLVGGASQVLAQGTRAIKADAAYRLTNAHAGRDKSLAVHEGEVVMSDNSDTPDQLWKFVLEKDGKYRLLNVGEGRAKSLDCRKNGDGFSLFMGKTGDYSGQSWTVTPLGGGKYRLINEYAGEGKSLDTFKSRVASGFAPVMNDSGDYSGQVWTLINETDD